MAHDGQLTMDDLEADIKFGERREKSSSLIPSACETASGDDRHARLAGSPPGARSALATLWYISDQASGELVGTSSWSNRASSKGMPSRKPSALAADLRYNTPPIGRRSLIGTGCDAVLLHGRGA